MSRRAERRTRRQNEVLIEMAYRKSPRPNSPVYFNCAKCGLVKRFNRYGPLPRLCKDPNGKFSNDLAYFVELRRSVRTCAWVKLSWVPAGVKFGSWVWVIVNASDLAPCDLLKEASPCPRSRR